jgi:hypothetical protein
MRGLGVSHLVQGFMGLGLLFFGYFLNRPPLGQLIDFVEIENVLSDFRDRIANQDFIVSAVASI